MKDKDIQRLMDLAQKGLKRKRSKEEILNTFVMAGILNLDGTYTDNYPNLKAWKPKEKQLSNVQHKTKFSIWFSWLRCRNMQNAS